MTPLSYALAGLIFVYLSGFRIWPNRYWVRPKMLIFAECFYALMRAVPKPKRYKSRRRRNLNPDDFVDFADTDRVIDIEIAGFDNDTRDYSAIEKLARTLWVYMAGAAISLATLMFVFQ